MSRPPELLGNRQNWRLVNRRLAWSGQQDLNLPQVIVIAQFGSDKQPDRWRKSRPNRAEILTVLRHGAVRGPSTLPTEGPPDPQNGSVGAVGRATEAEVQSFLARTFEIYREASSNVPSRGKARRAASMGGER